MSTRLSTSKYLKIQPKLVQEVATGLEDGAVIATRYGLSPEEWAIIEARPDFQAEVSRVRTEMEKSGQLVRLKATVMLDALLDNTFSHAMKEDTPVKDKATALQLLTKVAGVEGSAVASTGTGFSITINVPSVPVTQKKIDVVDDVVEVEDSGPLVIDFTGADNVLHEE